MAPLSDKEKPEAFTNGQKPDNSVDTSLPKMPELKTQDAEVSYFTNRKMRRAMAKRDKVFKTKDRRGWQGYNDFVRKIGEQQNGQAK